MCGPHGSCRGELVYLLVSGLLELGASLLLPAFGEGKGKGNRTVHGHIL